MELFGPRSLWKHLEEKQESSGRVGEGGGGWGHVDNGDTTDMINEFTEI